MMRKPIRWTWAKMVGALVKQGCSCGKATRHGRVEYEVFYPGSPPPIGAFRSRFDTVEEVRDAFGFHDDHEGVE